MITECQRIGKPILLSMGGPSSTSNFTSATQATEFASTLWSLFGADLTNTTTLPIRPFGPDVILDGFDIDSENEMPDHYATFASALREKFSENPTPSTKQFYLSGSPHCPLPDKSLPLDAMLQFDWVWPRFYNAMQCNLNSEAFLDSLSAWSKQLGTNGPRLFPGIAVSNLSASGNVPGSELEGYIAKINLTDVGNFGGLMLWDGSFALARDEEGEDFLGYAKRALVNLVSGWSEGLGIF
ncbi:glycoside hydrolase family 18 protein [Pseudocercospora fijiensis CIRAD86]|uniref:chitinase n=1 Tax=Pseudocercospora fijiensis (strain CIRAD86) TaxID=383855 RepID=M3AP70_PSEFD|nr:glycoside hydrolase family 18 protein [Pseudocercospora fijiensis CIRAD86]EME78918.1 glycoside hydrolase family 18 protein [Pseudocercospora fijiensis CIRAD86]